MVRPVLSMTDMGDGQERRASYLAPACPAAVADQGACD